MLHAEGSKKAEEMKVLRDECNSLKRKVDEEVDKAATLEDDLIRVANERDQMKMANHNLQQSLTQVQSQIQGKDKHIRLQTIDLDHASQTILRDMEKELDEERRKRKKLEEQLQPSIIPPLQHGADRGRNGAGLEAKIALLEKENAALKAESSRLESLASGSLSPVSATLSKLVRRPRSSSVSDGSDIDAQQLRDLLSEANTKANQLEAKVTKAEREKNKAYNEQIAAGKASGATIAALQESVSELRDEIQFQRENIIKGLESENVELKELCLKVPILENESIECRSQIASLQTQLSSSKEEAEKRREEMLVQSALISSGIAENAALKDEVTAAKEVEKRLQQKEKEVESAKRRTAKLSTSIRKLLRNLGGVPTNIGDETFALGNETSLFNMTMMTTSQEYEADLVDELEQLLHSIDEADRCIDFAQVEREVELKTAHAAQDEIAEKLKASEEAVASLEGIVSQRDAEMKKLGDDLQALEGRRCAMETSWREEQARATEIMRERDSITEQLQTSRDESEVLRSNLKASRETCERLEEDQRVANAKSAQIIEELQETISEKKCSQAELEAELVMSSERVSRLTRTIEDHASQIASKSVSLESLRRDFETIETSLAVTREDLERSRRSEHDLQLREAQLALDIFSLQGLMREQSRAAAEREVELLSLGLTKLEAERQEWENLIQDERMRIEQLKSHIAHLEKEGEAERDSIKSLATLSSEGARDRLALDTALEEIHRLQLDLQESRMKKQLAEDALARLHPLARDNDVTVIGDFSCFDVTQIHQPEVSISNSVMKEWESRLRIKSEEVTAARNEAYRWKEECDGHLSALQEQQEIVLRSEKRIEDLEIASKQSTEARKLAQTSLQTMQVELDARMIALQKSQIALQTSEEAILDLQREKEKIELERDLLREELSAMQCTTVKQVEVISVELQERNQECSMLRNEIEVLMEAAVALQRKLRDLDTVKLDLEVKCSELEMASSSHDAMQREHLERVSLLEKAIADDTERSSSRSEEMQALTEELKGAKEGYEILKKQMEARNAEFWETKEELAEWQERYERSQSDVKIKSELEERLKEVEDELDRVKTQSEQWREKCDNLATELSSLQKEKEER